MLQLIVRFPKNTYEKKKKKKKKSPKRHELTHHSWTKSLWMLEFIERS